MDFKDTGINENLIDGLAKQGIEYPTYIQQKTIPAMLEGKDIENDEVLSKHSDWAKEINAKYDINAENIDKIIEDEIGIVFAKVLEHAGVFKKEEDFLKFAKGVK